MLIDKTKNANGYQVASPIAGKYLHTLADPDENGIYRPTFTTISSDPIDTGDEVKFEDNIVYDGGGVIQREVDKSKWRQY